MSEESLSKTPEEIKKGLKTCIGECTGNKPHCPYHKCGNGCMDTMNKDSLAYIQQLESSRWELFDDLSTAYYGKKMYGLNDDGTVYSRYSCDTMSFEQAVDEFRRLIADE